MTSIQIVILFTVLLANLYLVADHIKPDWCFKAMMLFWNIVTVIIGIIIIYRSSH